MRALHEHLMLLLKDAIGYTYFVKIKENKEIDRWKYFVASLSPTDQTFQIYWQFCLLTECAITESILTVTMWSTDLPLYISESVLSAFLHNRRTSVTHRPQFHLRIILWLTPNAKYVLQLLAWEIFTKCYPSKIHCQWRNQIASTVNVTVQLS